MREPWRSFLYVILVGTLPLAFWYALWPHRKKLKNSSSEEPTKTAIEADG